MKILVISLIVVLLGILALFILYTIKLKPTKDVLKGSQLHIIHLLASQFINPRILDVAFFEAYNDQINQKFEDINPNSLTEHCRNMYLCSKDHVKAMEMLREIMIDKSVQFKALMVAEAIRLASSIDDTKYFSEGLLIPGSQVLRNYQDVLGVLNIRNKDVKQALTELNDKS